MTDEPTPKPRKPRTTKPKTAAKPKATPAETPAAEPEAPAAEPVAAVTAEPVAAEPAAETTTAALPPPEAPAPAPEAPPVAPVAPPAAVVPPAAAPPPPPSWPPPSAPAPPPAARGPRRAGKRTFLAAAAIAVAALFGGALGALATTALSDESTATTTVVETAERAAPTPTAALGAAPTVSDVYQAVADGVVEILVSGSGGGSSQLPAPFDDGEEQAPQPQGQGSGFVYDDTHIVTNHHVTDGATSIRVTLADGSTHSARLIGSDASTDLAVLELDASAGPLTPLPLGDSSALEVGEQVVAIGSPYGLEATVTTGIVSAVDRRITAPNGFAIPNAIQTDAAINHGNSGGPLLNMRGEVVGVNSQIESESGGNVGIGFAVPSNTLESIVSQILATGSVEHAFLGVSIETIPEGVAGDIGEAAGAAVAEVRDGSPAAAAGLQAGTDTETLDGVAYPTGGDVITQFDGEAIATAEELQSAVSARKPGDVVTLTVVRGGETRTVEVTLAVRP